ncbi:hypothetical protein ABH931_003852 [Streptacidiphilus sp. MAP12-33]|uniref:DUF4328 domain-containing protein n=1 Tax=Streptacidiphilus sp. MAP12-33 TaxID=3156266 RepID=UPI003515747F
MNGLGRWMCGTLVAFASATLLAGVAGWHLYEVLTAPPDPSDLGAALSRADMWFGNLTGWWRAALVASLVLFAFWLDDMRGYAEGLWPEGQRRHRAWAFFGLVVPLAQLFVPKMFMNDLWAAAEPADPARPRRRGHPLLTLWWLSLLAAGQWADGFSALKNATTRTAPAALRHLLLSEALYLAAAGLTITVVLRLGGRIRHAWSADPV